MDSLRGNEFCPREPGLFADIFRVLTDWAILIPSG
jgi:hypothetical protein